MHYFVQRFVFSILSLFILTLITFLLSQVVPGDPAIVAAGPNAGTEKIELLRSEMGLDEPLSKQFAIYAGKLVQGDLGKSWFTHQPIMEDLIRELPPSLELVIIAMLINLVISLPLGLCSARYNDTRFDSSVRLFAMIGAGLPIFWTALILQNTIAGQWQLLPIAGRLSFEYRTFEGITGFFLLDSLLLGRVDVFFDSLNHFN